MASRKNFPSRVEKRKLEAKTRQESYDKKPLDQKIAKSTVGSKEYTKLLEKSQK
jgi:hypothetical protein